MLTMITLLAAVTAPTPAAHKAGPFDPLTATYRSATGRYCIRSGWQTATRQSGQLIRAGECRTAYEWRRRGIEFARVASRAAGTRIAGG